MTLFSNHLSLGASISPDYLSSTVLYPGKWSYLHPQPSITSPSLRLEYLQTYHHFSWLNHVPGTKMFRFLMGKQAVKAVYRPRLLLSSGTTSRHVHSMKLKPPYTGPATYETIARRSPRRTYGSILN